MRSMRRVLILAAVAGIIPACGGSSNGGGKFFPSIATPIVVFTSDPEGDLTVDLFSADATGAIASLSEILGPGGQVTAFSWSPDRKWVAFVGDKEFGDRSGLYIVPAGGGQKPVRVTPQLRENITYFQFEWAPNSSRLAYLADETLDGVKDLHTVLPDGTGRLAVSGPPDGTGVTSFAWSPLSTQLAYRSDEDVAGRFELFVVQADGLNHFKAHDDIVNPTGDVGTVYKWSPSGLKIACSGDFYVEGESHLFMNDSDGSNPILLTGGDLSPLATLIGWAPNSSKVAYSEFNSGAIRTQNPDGTNLIDVTSLLDGVVWSADSLHLAGYSAELIVTAAADGSAAQIVGTSLFVTPPLFAWSPDSTRIAWFGDDSTGSTGEQRVRSSDWDGGNALTHSDANPFNNVAFQLNWAPDSSFITYVYNQDSAVTTQGYACAKAEFQFEQVNKPLVWRGNVYEQEWLSDSSGIVYQADADLLFSADLYLAPPIGSLTPIKLSHPNTLGSTLAYQVR